MKINLQNCMRTFDLNKFFSIKLFIFSKKKINFKYHLETIKEHFEECGFKNGGKNIFNRQF